MTRLSTVSSRLKRIGGSVWKNPALLASIAVTGLLLGGRQLGLLQALELSAFDKMMQLQPALPPDPRLLVVEVTEQDLSAQKDWPLTDAVINKLLKQLEQYQPAVIGLDIYRDLPVPPGNGELSERLQTSDRIVTACRMSNAKDSGTSPPPGVPEPRVGFIDIALDPSSVVRRGLLFVGEPISPCSTTSSFSFQLARKYLETQQGIEPELTPEGQLKLGEVVFHPLLPNDGGYQNGDTGGYQILLNYRSANSLAESVTLSEVLNEQVDPSLIKDRVVLIGSTAPSLKDTFLTPYNSGQQHINKMPGVEVHGQLVSQILSTVLDGQRLFWFWSEWGEILWIWGWSLTGGLLVLIARNPLQLLLGESALLSLMSGTSWLLFLGAGWVPVAAPALGLIASGTGVVIYSAYQAKLKQQQAEQERQYIEQKVKEQEFNIQQLHVLLKERNNKPPLTETEKLSTQAELLPDDSDDPTQVWHSEENSDDDPTQVWSEEEKDNLIKPKASTTRDAKLLTGRYKIQRVLGSGGFGLTHLAEDIHLPGYPQCVVKQLKPACQDPKFLAVARRLFCTEAEILQKLGNHSQIPQLMAYFEEKQEFYLVQEYIQGHSLSEELQADQRLPEAQVVELLKGVLEILMFVHQHSVIHRDIKPGNIMRREPDNKFVLIDFGAVKQIQSDQEATIAIGSRGYAPPEQYSGRPSFASDIYALGMIGIQALTGIAPYDLPHSDDEEINWRPLAKVSDQLAIVLDKMVRFKSFERYQSASLVIKELKLINT
ncbi:CHASE2 domain-containing protein [Lyngbya aestuarii]|uniref:CHASE2 domain-containing protein n=1 Tax=Lyngbya aestuarii TaxID=118322 RepID=UPI00403DED97